MFRLLHLIASIAFLGVALLSVANAASLYQAGFNRSSNQYEFGYRSIPNIPISGAPHDTDWDRWAMLHDGSVYRLYFFRQGSDDTFYQFGYNPGTRTYEYGYRSIPTLHLSGIPPEADTSRFVMLHDGRDYRLYLPDRDRPWTLHQFAFNRSTRDYEYGYRSIPVLRIKGMPEDADWQRIAMLHDGKDYRFYAMSRNADDLFFQAAFNRRTEDYEHGFRSIPQLYVTGMPNTANPASIGMLHDRSVYRFYMLGE